MQFPFDALGKLLLDAALDPLCEFTENPAVPLDTRFADAMTVPRTLARERFLERGVLGAMATEPAVFDLCAKTLSTVLVDESCARASMLRAKHRTPLRHWMTSQGLPRRVIADWQLGETADWGPGISVHALARAPRVITLPPPKTVRRFAPERVRAEERRGDRRRACAQATHRAAATRCRGGPSPSRRRWPTRLLR